MNETAPTTAKWTPGPWEPMLRHDGIPFGVGAHETMRDDGDYLCLLPSKSARWSKETIHANARLIAAAPELMEALKAAFNFCSMVQASGSIPPFNTSPLLLISKAIATAESQ